MQKPPYYALLDGARGIAAVCVVFVHYVIFYFPVGAKSAAESLTLTTLPLFWLFGPIYVYGNSAVQLFWILSGFIFATVYTTEVSAVKFASARFARLYPLHFLTLILVAGLQLVALAYDGGFLVGLQHNDLYHFFLNITFTSAWGFHYGESFNYPIWSVSVEILIYAVFWLSLKFMRKLGIFFPALLVGLFCALYAAAPVATIIWYCGACFYIGVVLRAIFDLTENATRARLALALPLFATGPALYFLFPNLGGKVIALASLPGLVLLLASLETAAPNALKKAASWAGDCSYGIYLWQIPIAISLLLVLDLWVGSRAAVSSTWFLALFLFSTIGVARVSFVLFEQPMRERLRMRSDKSVALASMHPDRLSS
jgi:peptidoglycan/LPS O-acetylase OafA/YrhL